MTYRAKFSANEYVEVDDRTGERLKNALIDGDKDGTFVANNSVYQVRDVKAVIADKEHTHDDFKLKYADQIKKFGEKLAVFSKQSAEEKAKREIKYRIKAGLTGLTPASTWEDIARFLVIWFRKNPEYPYCPFTEWVHLVFPFGYRNIPGFYQLVVRHDNAVYEWMHQGDVSVPAPKDEADLVGFFSSDLVSDFEGGDNK